MIIQFVSGVANLAGLPVVGAVVLVALSMGLTLISGLIPSRIAARKDPVVALRTE
jgi:putative ABC transport system permease protein